MATKQIELILMREISDHLTMPIFVVDDAGALVFYNEPAEKLLGLRFDETGAMPLDDWATRFVPTASDGAPLAPEDLPIVTALQQRRPDHGEMWITGHDGVRRCLAVTGVPLSGQSGRHVGAAAIFWEIDR